MNSYPSVLGFRMETMLLGFLIFVSNSVSMLLTLFSTSAKILQNCQVNLSLFSKNPATTMI